MAALLLIRTLGGTDVYVGGTDADAALGLEVAAGLSVGGTGVDADVAAAVQGAGAVDGVVGVAAALAAAAADEGVKVACVYAVAAGAALAVPADFFGGGDDVGVAAGADVQSLAAV